MPFLLGWRGGRYLYVLAMTKRQKRILRRHQKVLFGDESFRRFGSFDVDKIFASANLLDLDRHYSHKRAGFKSCEEYYHWSSSRHYIDKVITVCLIKKIFHQMTSNKHFLHSLLPKVRHTKALSSLRSHGHNYQLPQIEFGLCKNSFLNRCLFFLHLN